MENKKEWISVEEKLPFWEDGVKDIQLHSGKEMKGMYVVNFYELSINIVWNVFLTVNNAGKYRFTPIERRYYLCIILYFPTIYKPFDMGHKLFCFF